MVWWLCCVQSKRSHEHRSKQLAIKLLAIECDNDLFNPSVSHSLLIVEVVRCELRTLFSSSSIVVHNFCFFFHALYFCCRAHTHLSRQRNVCTSVVVLFFFSSSSCRLLYLMLLTIASRQKNITKRLLELSITLCTNHSRIT